MRPDKRLTTLAREVCRWYFRRFPLRNGKDFFYQRLQKKLAPKDRWANAKLRRGFLMQLDMEDADQRRMYFYGDYDERREADLITRVLNPGEVFWDVGANIGYFTLLAARSLKNTGQVVAFEPGQAAFSRLLANISLNPFTNIATYQIALADREGEGVLYCQPRIADGRANLFRPGSGQREGERVAVATLDGWRERHRLVCPDFIKMDVEGAELAVLQGAQKTLTCSTPMLLVEMKEAILRDLGLERRAFQEFLKRWGYLPAGLKKGRWYLYPDANTITGRNVWWLNPEIAGHREKALRAGLRGLK